MLSRGIFTDGSEAVRATGKVEVQLRDEPWGPVDPSVELKPGDRIHTGHKGNVTLTLPDGSKLIVGQMALVKIDTLNGRPGRASGTRQSSRGS